MSRRHYHSAYYAALKQRHEQQQQQKSRKQSSSNSSVSVGGHNKPSSSNTGAAANDDDYALLIGIEYVAYARSGQMSRLPGCHKDMTVVQRLLSDVYNVPSSNMHILMDDGAHSSPTAAAIRSGLQWLRSKSALAKRLWIFYSGHGSYVADTNSDERDGRDEVLVAADFLSAGYIKDDELALYAQSLPNTVSLNCMFDCCHSGSILDLPFYYHTKDKGAAQHVETADSMYSSSSPVGGGGASVACFSACADNQTSVSAYNLDSRREWQGALTYAFDTAVREKRAAAAGGVPSSSSLLLDAKQLMNRMGELIAARGYDQITTYSFFTSSTSLQQQQQLTFPAAAT